MNRLTLRAIVLGGLLGLVLAELRRYFGLSNFVVLGGLFLFLLLEFGYRMYQSYQKQKNLGRRIGETFQYLEDDPHRFLRMNEKLYQEFPVDFFRLKILSSMIVGYEKVGNLDGAIDKIEAIRPNKLPKEMQEFYHGVKAMLYFKNREPEKAIRVMDRQKQLFSKYERNVGYMGSIFFYDYLMRLIAEGKASYAYKELALARQKMGESFLEEEFSVYTQQVDEQPEEEYDPSKEENSTKESLKEEIVAATYKEEKEEKVSEEKKDFPSQDSDN